MDDELRLILAFSHTIEDRSATAAEAVPLRNGVLNDDFPHSWMHNLLRGADLVFLYADEDDWLKELHRKLGFDSLALRYLFTKSVA